MSDSAIASVADTGISVSQRWVIVVLLSLGMVIAYISRSDISVVLAIPEFVKYFHLSDTGRGFLNSAFFWAYTALQFPAGWTVDRYGVKLPYALGFALWCLASVAMGLTYTAAMLVTLRVLLGAFESLVAPASLTWIYRHFKEENRGLALGVYLTGTKIGPAISAPLTVWLTMLYGWRLMFILVGIGGALWLIPWLLLVEKDVPLQAPKVRKTDEPPIPFRRIMASGVIWGSISISFCYMYFVYFCMTWMPAYFVEQRHLSLSKMGFYTFFSFAGMAVVAALAGWGADRLIALGGNAVTVRKWFIIVGFAIAATELIGARTSSLNLALFIAILSLSGLGMATANFWAVTQTLVPAYAMGRVCAIVNCSASFSGIAAPLITGWLKQRSGGYQAPMQAILVILVFGLISYLLLMREKYAPRAIGETKLA